MIETRYNIPVQLLERKEGTENARAYKSVIVDWFGQNGWKAYKGWKRNDGNVDIYANELGISEYFFRQLANAHRFPDNASSDWLRTHWRTSLEIADKTIGYLENLCIPSGEGYNYSGQRAEVSNHSSWPAALLRSMATPHRGSGFDLTKGGEIQFEVRRKVLLAVLGGDFEAFKNQASLEDRRDLFIEILNHRTFQNGGKVDEWRRFGYFDSATNEFKGHGENSQPPDEFTDVKSLFEFTRFIEGIGPVIFRTRVKSPEQAIIKALIESRNKGSNIEALPSVEDLDGAKIVLIEGGIKEVDQVMDMVVGSVKNAMPGTKVSPKDKPKANRRQNPRIAEGQRRRLFEFPGQEGIYYELYVRTLAAEMNAYYRSGLYDLRRGRLEGWGHRHYELERAALIFDLVFPQDIYRLDQRSALLCQSIKIADQLRREKAVHLGRIRPEVMVAGSQAPAIIFKEGSYVLTQPKGTNLIKCYLIEGTDRSGVILRKMEGGSDATFKVYPPKVAATGRIGREEFIGIQEWLLGGPLKDSKGE